MRPSTLLAFEGEPLDALYLDYELALRVGEARDSPTEDTTTRTKTKNLVKAYGEAPDAAQVKDFLVVPDG